MSSVVACLLRARCGDAVELYRGNRTVNARAGCNEDTPNNSRVSFDPFPFTRAEVDVTRTRGSPRFVVRESESAAPSPKGHMEFAAFLNIGAELTIVDVRVDATSAAAAPPGMHVVRLRAADAVRSGASAGAGAGGFVVPHDMSSRMQGRSLHRRPPPLPCRQVLLERLPSSRARFASRFVSRHATAHSSGAGCGARVRGAAALDGAIARQVAELRDAIATGWRCGRARGRSPGTFRGGDSPGGGTCRWFPRRAVAHLPHACPLAWSPAPARASPLRALPSASPTAPRWTRSR